MQFCAAKSATLDSQKVIEISKDMIEMHPVPTTRRALAAGSKQHHSHRVITRGPGVASVQQRFHDGGRVACVTAAESSERGGQRVPVSRGGIHLGSTLLDFSHNHVGNVV